MTKGESMGTNPLFWKEFFFRFFSPPTCRYALENTFDGEKTRSFLLKIPSSGAIFGTPMSESMETHQLFGNIFFSIFSLQKCRNALENTFDEKKKLGPSF
jgi:hypothetical protein